MGRAWVLLWVTDAAMWVIGSFQVALLLTVGLSLFYGMSLLWAEFDCPRCSGRNRTQAPWPWRAMFPGIQRSGCRSRRCIAGRRLRLGVKILQPARAQKWLSRQR